MRVTDKAQPLVSVIMNCYNCDRFLVEALDSVYAQSYQNWEIIFWDNASTDGSAIIAKSYDKKVKYFLHPEMTSLGKARNMALKKANGKYIAFLDCDDLYLVEKIRKQVGIMESRKDVGLCYSNTVYFSENANDKKAYEKIMPSGHIFKNLLEGYFMSFETVMIRKSVLDEKEISFSLRYRVSTDADIFTRISYYTKCYYVDEVLAKWRYGHGSESDKSLCLFPVEYEELLSQLSDMIDDFDRVYSKSIDILKTKVLNMHGLCCWSRGDKVLAREYFRSAAVHSIKYLIPLLLSFVFDYGTYNNIRRKWGRV
jgi:glycosyltransferase involved in cell wall biosynthesis